jgi:hypothetical protein
MDFFRPLKLVIVLFVVSFSIFAYSYPLVPRQDLTYGQLCSARNPDFEGYRYTERIPYCERNVSREQKEKIYNLYRIPVSCRGRYTIDHFIPLSIGGDNSDVNLWPEHKLVKATRPQLEQELFVALSRGQISQKNAIELIVREKTKPRKIQSSTSADACDRPSR